MNWQLVTFGGIAVALIAAVVVSIRRNAALIEAFDQPELEELQACLANRRVDWAKRKLAERGWLLTDVKTAQGFAGKSIVSFRRSDDGQPIKAILHFLNRNLQLPIGTWDLSQSSSGKEQ